MLERIDAYTTRKQNRLRRDTILYRLAIWLLQVVPPGVVNTTQPEALFIGLRNAVDRLASEIELTDFDLMAQYAAALVCLGKDFESHYPAIRAVLRSKVLSQAERAQWFVHYLNSFPYLRGERFNVPTPQQPLPPELWPKTRARSR